jgi:hypothetical protein
MSPIEFQMLVEELHALLRRSWSDATKAALVAYAKRVSRLAAEEPPGQMREVLEEAAFMVGVFVERGDNFREGKRTWTPLWETGETDERRQGDGAAAR